jgi:hypothetical protein
MKHTITIEFTTDSRLTESQMDNLISMLSLQVEEPQDLDGESEDWRGREISFRRTDRHAGRFFTREETK